MWEPLTANRFLVYLTDTRSKKLIVESFLIKHIDRPGFTWVDGKKQWNPICLKIYESLAPNNVLFRCLKASIFDVQVNELGPVGDVVETWLLPHCKFASVTPQPLDWARNGDVFELQCELDWNEIIVKDGDSEFKIQK